MEAATLSMEVLMAAISELEASVLALDVDSRVRLTLALLNSPEKVEPLNP